MADFNDYKEIPENIRKAQKFIIALTAMGISFSKWTITCERFDDTQAGVLRAFNAIIDSSDRYEGVLLKSRLSHHEEFHWGGSAGAWRWTIRKLQAKEQSTANHEPTAA